MLSTGRILSGRSKRNFQRILMRSPMELVCIAWGMG
jgi:hypothetical protein